MRTRQDVSGLESRLKSNLAGPVMTVAAAVATALFLPPEQAFALPAGAEVVAGNVTVTVDGTQMRLDQLSNTAIMNWQQFNIAPNELVRILQNSPDAAMLARVTGGNPSELLGRLQADGRVFLINPKGVIVGQGAMIDTAAFLASTLDVADADFLKQGALTFKGDSDAGIVNLGKITAHEGNVVLVAHTVKNTGELSAEKGSVGLAAGSEIYLAAPDAPLFIIKANLPAAAAGSTGVDNQGVISAAQAQLEAAGGSIYDLAVNQSGTIRAAGVERRPDGRVLITAGGGNVSVTGSTSAHDANGSGGEILVGGDFQGRNAEVANAATVYVGDTARLDASASSTTGDGGRVVVWSDEATTYRGSIEARAGNQGGNGGFAEVSGKQSLAFSGSVDLSAAAGRRGELLLDPDNLTIVPGVASLPDTLGADSLVSLLANSSVTLQARDKITVDAPVIVEDPDGIIGPTLALEASSIALNETLSLRRVGGTIRLLRTDGGAGFSLTSAANAELAAYRLDIDGFPIVTLNGPVTARELFYSTSALTPATSFTATHQHNDISLLNITDSETHTAPVSFTGNVSLHSNTVMSVEALFSANEVALSSNGNLIMSGADGARPASNITATERTRLASLDGVFINQAGPGLLSGPARQAIYTSDINFLFSLDGMTGFRQVDYVAFPNDPQVMEQQLLYVRAGAGASQLTITANDFIRLYGQPDPVFTASYFGGTESDLTQLPSFSILEGTPINVGKYTIVPSGAASATHSIAYANGTLTIDPVVLTYAANPFSRVYGDDNPWFTGSVTGFVNGETLDSATTGTLLFSSASTPMTPAGATSIFGSGLTALHGNYIFEQAASNASALTIERAPLTVTFGNATRLYGHADPQFAMTYSGLRNGEDASVLTGLRAVTNATIRSSVGDYEITGTGSDENYLMTFVPGRLAITRAPLSLEALPVDSIYGNVPPIGYRVNGLLNSDSPDVLTGVLLDKAFFNTTAPGVYLYGFSSLGTAQNYEVLSVVPRFLTIAKKPISGLVLDTRTLLGATPAQFDAVFTEPVRGGPQFLIRGDITRASQVGTHTVTPVIEPLGGATLAELEQYYTFDLTPGRMFVDAPPLPPLTLTQTIVTEEEAKEKLKSLNDPVSRVRIVTNLYGENTFTPVELARAVEDFVPSIIPHIGALLANDTELSPFNRAVLQQVQSGKLSPSRLAELIETNVSVRLLFTPLLNKAVFDAVASGQPLSLSQQALVARVANRINEQRRELATELTRQMVEFQKEKAAIGASNQYALKTMPDIAVTAQEAVTNRMIGAALGAAGGTVVAGATIAALKQAGLWVVKEMVANSAKIAGEGAKYVSYGAGGASALIGVAISLVVIGVEAAIMVEEDNRNKAAYDLTMERARNKVDAKLTGFDLNDARSKSEFLTAFTLTMAEAGAIY